MNSKKAETTVNAMLAGFLDQKKTRVKQSTYSRYYGIARCHIVPALGEREITAITVRELEVFLADMQNPGRLEAATINSVISLLRQIFKYASAIGLDVADCNNIERAHAVKYPVDVYSAADMEKLKDWCVSNISTISFGILLCLYTGLRIGELCALKWADFNQDCSMLHVRRTVQRIQNASCDDKHKTSLIVDRPKSNSSIRTIPVPECVQKVARAMVKSPECYILSGRPDKPMDPRQCQNLYKQCIEQVGISYKNFHVLRHSFATRCAALGFDPKTLSEILGHSDVSITYNIYVHPSMELKRSYMEMLD